MTATRRNIIAGATALAVGAILPAAAATRSRNRGGARLLAHVALTRTLVERYAGAKDEAHRTFVLVNADPELIAGGPAAWARAQIAGGSTLTERALLRLYRARVNRVYVRHGYRAASDAWDDAGKEARRAIASLSKMRPETIAGASAKATILRTAAEDDELVYPDQLGGMVLAAIVADLEWLAARAPAG